MFERLDAAYQRAPAYDDRVPLVPALDPLLANVARGCLVLVSGPPLLTRGLAVRAVRDVTGPPDLGETCVLYLTARRAAVNVAEELLCDEARVPRWALRAGQLQRDAMTRLTYAANALAKRRITFESAAPFNPTSLRRRVERWRDTFVETTPTVVVLERLDAIVARHGRPVDRRWRLRRLRSLAQRASAVVLACADGDGSDAAALGDIADVVITLACGAFEQARDGRLTRAHAVVEVVSSSVGPVGAATLDLARWHTSTHAGDEH